MTLIATTELRDWIGLEKGDQGESHTRLRRVLDGTVRRFERDTGTPVFPCERVEHVTPREPGLLALPYPVPEGATLTVEIWDGEAWENLPVAAYESITDPIKNATFLRRLAYYDDDLYGQSWPVSIDRSVRLTYTDAGFDSDTLPEDIREAILDFAAWRMRSRFPTQAPQRNRATRSQPIPPTYRRAVAVYRNYYKRRRSSVRLVR